MDPELATLLTELVEKVGLLRRDMQHKGELEKYEARFSRIEQKFSALAERISRDNPRSPRRSARRGSSPPEASPSGTPIIRRSRDWRPVQGRPTP